MKINGKKWTSNVSPKVRKNIFLKKDLTICNAFAIPFSRTNDLSKSVVQKQKEILKNLGLQGHALLRQKVTARVSNCLMFNAILNCACGHHCCTLNFGQNSCPREEAVLPAQQMFCISLWWLFESRSCPLYYLNYFKNLGSLDSYCCFSLLITTWRCQQQFL